MNRYVLVALVVGILGLFAFLLPSQKSEDIHAISNLINDDPKSAVHSTIHNKPLDVSTLPTQSFESAWKDCLDIKNVRNFDDFKREILHPPPELIKDHDIPLENWHIRLSSGEEERVMLVTSDTENTNHMKELRLFGVDQEGLPVPKKGFPILNPQKKIMDETLARGEVFFHQKKQYFRYHGGMEIESLLENDQVKEFQVFINNKILSCDAQTCFCEAHE